MRAGYTLEVSREAHPHPRRRPCLRDSASVFSLLNSSPQIKSEIVKVNGAMGTAQELEMIMHNEKVLVLTIRLPAKRPTYKS